MDQLQENCGIIVCQQIYIPMNMSANICWIFIKIIPNLLPTKLRLQPGKFQLPTNIDHYK